MNSISATTAPGDQSPDSMNFAEFVEWSQWVALNMPDVRLQCETRIARAFAPFRPTVIAPSHFAPVHRCDLAKLWCEIFGLPPDMARAALVCEGVRHGLGLIFRCLAKASERVAVPSDVYPVYWHIAREAQVDAIDVETFPTFDLDRILEATARSGANFLVLPAPLKLHGRRWTDDEVAQAIAWLHENTRRRLILDRIYSFGSRIDPSAKRLLETGQVIYLDSLSKGWLHEKTLGIAIVPQNDIEIYAPSFRSLNPPQDTLFRARELLTRYRQLPKRLTEEIDSRRTELVAFFGRAGLRTFAPRQGYFVAVETTVPNLLHVHRLLAIPASVFGSTNRRWSLATALPSRTAA
jgi:aspartate/methionine/tyrosine aminotransferase